MSKFLLAQSLYSHKKKILVSGAAEKSTNMNGPKGIGYSSYRSSSGVQAAAKYSGAALLLDAILIKKNIAVMEANDNVYAEVTLDGKVYAFTATKKAASYEAEELTNYEKVFAPLLFHLRSKSPYTELRDIFITAIDEYSSTGCVKTETLLQFCDAFYYGVAKEMTEEYINNEASLSLETVQQAIDTGHLTPMDALRGLDLPAFTRVGESITSSSSIASASRGDILKDAQNGKFRIPYEWNEKQVAMIAKNQTLDAFITSESFEDVLTYTYGSLQEILTRLDSGMESSAAIKDDVLNITLFGDPSGGKSTIANALGEALGLPVYTVSQSKYTEEDTYWGKTTATENGFVNVPTPFLDAFINGGIAVLEEVNLVDPGVTMGALGNAIWAPFILMKDGHKPVQRHPLCIVIGTKNIGTFGSRDVNQAFNNRFVQTFEIEEPSKDEFIRFLALHDSDIKRCTWVYDVYARITKYLKEPSINAEDILKSISFRSCLGVLKGIKYGQAPKRAVKNSIVNKITESDKELGHQIYNDIVLTMPSIV